MSDAEFDKTQILSRPPSSAVPEGPSAVLRCVDTTVLKNATGAEIQLEESEVTIGRGSENVVALDANGVSRNHARIFLRDGAWQVKDLGSTNGTRVNNSKVDQCALGDGDTVAFGRVCYKFHVDGEAGAGNVVNLDLGASEQTVIMQPTQRPAPAPPPAPAAEPGAEQVYDTGARKRIDREPAPERRSNALLVVVALVLLVAAGAAAAFYLGMI